MVHWKVLCKQSRSQLKSKERPIEVIYAIKRDLLGLIGSKEDWTQKTKDLYLEIRKLPSFKPFQDRRTDIVAYRGDICNQKGMPLVHWNIGKLYENISSLLKRLESYRPK